MAGKERCDNSTMNWASCVTNLSCDSAGGSRRLRPDEHQRPTCAKKIRLIRKKAEQQRSGQSVPFRGEYVLPAHESDRAHRSRFGYRDRCPLSDPLHRRNLFVNGFEFHKSRKRRTSDSMMHVGICESATRAMRCCHPAWQQQSLQAVPS